MSVKSIKPIGMLFEIFGMLSFAYLGYKLAIKALILFGIDLDDPQYEEALIYIGMFLIFTPMMVFMLFGACFGVLTWTAIVAKFSGLSKAELLYYLRQKENDTAKFSQHGVGYGFYVKCCERVSWNRI